MTDKVGRMPIWLRLFGWMVSLAIVGVAIVAGIARIARFRSEGDFESANAIIFGAVGATLFVALVLAIIFTIARKKRVLQEKGDDA